MHSKLASLAILFTLFSFAFAENNDNRNAFALHDVRPFALVDKRSNEGRFARFARSSNEERDPRFAFAFAKRSAPSDDAIEQMAEKFARRFARDVIQSGNERGFAFA